MIACSAAAPPPAMTPTAEARKQGPASASPEVVGRWMLSEMLAPGGSPEGVRKARARLDELKAEGMYPALAKGLDDYSHGLLESSGRSFLKALQGARDASGDPLAPLVGWFAINHLLTIDQAVPGLWKDAKAWVQTSLEAPGSLGWRARGEMVEWWTRHAFEDAEANLSERAVGYFGCAREVRLAGPFGHGVSGDRWRSFGAEKPGPWPAQWAPGLRGEIR
jgi:cellulose synthase operon protein C